MKKLFVTRVHCLILSPAMLVLLPVVFEAEAATYGEKFYSYTDTIDLSSLQVRIGTGSASLPTYDSAGVGSKYRSENEHDVVVKLRPDFLELPTGAKITVQVDGVTISESIGRNLFSETFNSYFGGSITLPGGQRELPIFNHPYYNIEWSTYIGRFPRQSRFELPGYSATLYIGDYKDISPTYSFEVADRWWFGQVYDPNDFELGAYIDALGYSSFPTGASGSVGLEIAGSVEVEYHVPITPFFSEEQLDSMRGYINGLNELALIADLVSLTGKAKVARNLAKNGLTDRNVRDVMNGIGLEQIAPSTQRLTWVEGPGGEKDFHATVLKRFKELEGILPSDPLAALANFIRANADVMSLIYLDPPRYDYTEVSNVEDLLSAASEYDDTSVGVFAKLITLKWAYLVAMERSQGAAEHEDWSAYEAQRNLLLELASYIDAVTDSINVSNFYNETLASLRNEFSSYTDEDFEVVMSFLLEVLELDSGSSFLSDSEKLFLEQNSEWFSYVSLYDKTIDNPFDGFKFDITESVAPVPALSSSYFLATALLLMGGVRRFRVINAALLGSGPH